MSVTILGSIFAILLVVLVIRDLARVNALLALAVLAYAIAIAWFTSRGAMLPTAERLPPNGLIAGQFLMLMLVLSTVLLGARSWREIPVVHFFAWHSVRFPMGIIMVYVAYSGALAPQFGWGAGIGEIVVGAWAALLVAVPSLRTVQSCVGWCAVGLLDVLIGMVTAALTFRSPLQQFAHAEQMRVMSILPMVLIPSFSMAVLTVSTFLVFFRRNELPGTVQPVRMNA